MVMLVASGPGPQHKSLTTAQASCLVGQGTRTSISSLLSHGHLMRLLFPTCKSSSERRGERQPDSVAQQLSEPDQTQGQPSPDSAFSLFPDPSLISPCSIFPRVGGRCRRISQEEGVGSSFCKERQEGV